MHHLSSTARRREFIQFDDPFSTIVNKYIGEPRRRPKRMYLFPFTRIYFRPNYLSSNFRMTPATQFYLIIGTAAALLLVVCINFMNLATARYINRAREVGLRNITVNAIAPGFIKTEMTDVLPDEVKAQMLAAVPLKRPGTPADVANAALFLASDYSSYITGQVIVVDGGMVM